MELASGELVALIHQEHATGEPGDPISHEVQRVIHMLAQIGYGVIDFGEQKDNSIELWFSKVTLAQAAAMAESFIVRGGDV